MRGSTWRSAGAIWQTRSHEGPEDAAEKQVIKTRTLTLDMRVKIYRCLVLQVLTDIARPQEGNLAQSEDDDGHVCDFSVVTTIDVAAPAAAAAAVHHTHAVGACGVCGRR